MLVTYYSYKCVTNVHHLISLQVSNRPMSRVPSSLFLAFRSLAPLYGSGTYGSHGALPVLSLLHNLHPAAAPTFVRAASSQPLMRVQQQQQHEQQHGSSRSWVKLAAAGAAAAGAAAAGWSVWSDLAATKRAQALADASQRSAQPTRASFTTQSALVSCYAGPLVSLLHGSSPTNTQLQTLAAAITAEAAVLNPWELLNALWGLAMFDAQLSPEQLQTLMAAVTSNLSHMTVYQAVVTAWSVTMLCGSSNDSSSYVWQQLQQRLKAARVDEYDEPVLLYLLHAAVQQAAAAGDAHSPGTSPRATEQEVLQQVAELPKAVQSKVAAAFKEFVPFQQYIEGPYLVILHIAKALPSQISAAAAASTTDSSSSNVSPYRAVFGGFSTGDADAAITTLSDKGLLSKLRRKLYFGWRSDQLLDSHQASLNQAYYVLSRRLNLQQVQQPPDVDILLPTLKAAVFLDDDAGQATAQTHIKSSTSSHGSTSIQHKQALHADVLLTQAHLHDCHEALEQLTRNRYSAPSGGFQAKITAGIRAAKSRCLQQRGWRVVHISMSEVEACMEGAGAGKGERVKPRDLAAGHVALEALLRQRLQL